MEVGIQISSFKPLMTDEAGLLNVLAHMRAFGVEYTALQWIDKSIPVETIARALKDSRIMSRGIQDKTHEILSDTDYYLRLNRVTGGSEFCFSGIPGGDTRVLINALKGIETRAAGMGMYLSYHPVKNDFGGPCEELLRLKPELHLTADVCQIRDAGLDPAAFILKYAGRIDIVHFKDRAANGALTSVGSGTADFESAAVACKKAGVKLILAEQEQWTHAFKELEEGFIYTKNLLSRLEA